MPTSSSSAARLQLGKVQRERFLAEVSKAMVEIGAAVQQRLTELIDEPCVPREVTPRRDAWMAYKDARQKWVDLTLAEWRACLSPVPVKKDARSLDMGGMELVGTEVVENKILASRMVLAVNDKVISELDDVRVRIKFLEGIDDLDGRDLMRPEVLVLLLVEQWPKSGMSPDSWALVSEVVQRILIERTRAAYKAVNAALIAKGVLPVIELKDRVKGPKPAGAGAARAPLAPAAGPQDSPQGRESGIGPLHDGGYPQDPYGGGYGGGSAPGPGPGYAPGNAAARGAQGYGAGANNPAGHAPAAGYGGSPGGASGGDAPEAGGRGFFGGRLGWRANAAPPSQMLTQPAAPVSGPGFSGSGSGSSGATPFWKQQAGHSGNAQAYSTDQETRMLTVGTPLARARSRAQGVLGQLKRIFVNSAGPDYGGVTRQPPSAALSQALSHQVMAAQYAAGGTLYEDYSPAGVARVAGDLREKTDELKKKAETKGEKATIEIVALMFQAILAEERIPSGIRVWFARLQMPVLRVALEDADFLGTADHPARLLIDRMGSCVMGFDGTGVQSAAMETEVKRIVQVIEQYPETGKKVYQIVHEEFQKFLSKFLTEKGANQKVVSVAQQVEQKETLAIQYTIEMRNMLKDMPVRDEIRDFLFKIWAEVLAVSALRKGPKHADTQTLKKCATDLVWAASAKPNRADRARVIQDLPGLLLRLRSGMTLLAMAPSEQEGHVKKINDTLADAFLSKTQAIPQAKIDAMAQRLSNLEDYVSDDPMGDLPLDSESLEMMLGIDASAIEVVSGGGSKPSAAMLAWAGELQLGSWFTLDHNSKITQVQFAWRSERKHLNLFASTAGKSYLIQGGRLAAYLQAGLLLPQEEEALTVRATRDALAKIEANPGRLLT